MKESSFYSDEFEQLIRDKTEQYKMYPSENVWKGIHSSLHTKRKWFIGSMALLVTGILYFSGKELIAPSGHPAVARKLAAAGSPSSDGSATDLSKINQPEDVPHSTFVRLGSANTSTTSTHHANTAGVSGAEEADQPYKGLTISINNPVISQPDLSEMLSHAVRLPRNAPSLIDVKDAAGATAMVRATAENHPEPGILDSWLVRNAPENPASHKGADAAALARNNDGNANPGATRESADIAGSRETGREIQSEEVTARSVLESLSARGPERLSGGRLARTKSNRTEPSLTGSALKDSAGESTRVNTAAIGEASDRGRINWLHDYAMYTLPAAPSGGRLFLQMTLAPTINYRALAGGDFAPSKNLQGGPVALMHPGDAQNWVDHSPAVGFEFGGSLLYRVTRNLTIKGGLQFNFSRYKILAYASKPQQATITLNSSYGEYVDSINSITTASNFGGRTQETLNNDYYQLSAPIGFEMRILGNERLQFNVGATIQPSYLLNTNSYMLTADYTNYTKEPSLFRRWNISGGLEAFLSYQMGPIRWQIGPEFRYQLLSTYNSKYPINENLKGYGLKIGITKQLP
jgi:hypothetical protein